MDTLTNIDGGRIVKMEVDYSGACDEKIPMYKEAAKDPNKFHQSIDGLLQLEKQTRLVRFFQNEEQKLQINLQNFRELI